MSELKYAVLRSNEELKFKKLNEDSYEILKREIQSVIDVVTIGELDLWFDDEFLLKDEIPDPTLIIKKVNTDIVTPYDIVLRGPVVFASHNEAGETISLTREAREIMSELIPIKVNGKMAYLLPYYE